MPFPDLDDLHEAAKDDHEEDADPHPVDFQTKAFHMTLLDKWITPLYHKSLILLVNVSRRTYADSS